MQVIGIVASRLTPTVPTGIPFGRRLAITAKLTRASTGAA